MKETRGSKKRRVKKGIKDLRMGDECKEEWKGAG